MAAATVLDFSTLIDLRCVRIDGASYPIRHPDAMSLIQVKRLQRQTPRLGVLLQQDEWIPDEEAEVTRLLASTCRDVLDAPDEIHAKLTDGQRLAILDVFTQLRPPMRAQASGATAGGPSPSGARKSRASSGSTGATRKAG